MTSETPRRVDSLPQSYGSDTRLGEHPLNEFHDGRELLADLIVSLESALSGKKIELSDLEAEIEKADEMMIQIDAILSQRNTSISENVRSLFGRASEDVKKISTAKAQLQAVKDQGHASEDDLRAIIQAMESNMKSLEAKWAEARNTGAIH